MKRIIFIMTAALFFIHGNLFAMESGIGEDIEEYSDFYDSLKLYGCYNLVDQDGSEQVAEYEYLHNSISVDGEARFIRLPHRAHFDLIIKNRKDYSGDLSYAYKDILSFRAINYTIFHNLENIKLIDPDTSTLSPGVERMDAGKDYAVQTGLSTFLLRLKTPDFPLHAYVDASIVKKEGTQQQRFMSGAAWFNEQVRASRSRDVNWKTEDIKIGANSHLGPVELGISHSEKRFSAGGDDVLYDNYSTSGFGTGFRNAGEYPHNLVPDQRGSTDTLKVHTSYTGKFVASATLSRTERDNIDSGAEAYYINGSGEVTWMPMEKLAFFLKYRYRERDVDSPDSVTITDLSNPTNTYTYDVKQSISSVLNRFSGTARYRAFKGLTLNIKLSHDDIRRKDAEEWQIPHETIKNTVSVSADLRLKKNLKFKTNFTHKFINNPSVNIEPDSSDEGKVSLSWIPLKWLNTFFSYSIKKGERDELHFKDTEEADKRETNQHHFLGSVTLLPLKDLSLTASYFYLNDRTTQDMEYHDTAGLPNIDNFVPYRSNAHNYTVDIYYDSSRKWDLNTGFNHTRSSGRFNPDDINLTEPVSIASFSELKTEATVYYISGKYIFSDNFSSFLQYRYSRLDDMLDNPYDDIENGRVHIVLLTLLKKW